MGKKGCGLIGFMIITNQFHGAAVAQQVEQVDKWLEGHWFKSWLPRAELSCMLKSPWARHWIPNCSWGLCDELANWSGCTLSSPGDSWESALFRCWLVLQPILNTLYKAFCGWKKTDKLLCVVTWVSISWGWGLLKKNKIWGCDFDFFFFCFPKMLQEYNAKCSTTPIKREERPKIGVMLFQFEFKDAPG